MSIFGTSFDRNAGLVRSPNRCAPKFPESLHQAFHLLPEYRFVRSWNRAYSPVRSEASFLQFFPAFTFDLLGAETADVPVKDAVIGRVLVKGRGISAEIAAGWLTAHALTPFSTAMLGVIRSSLTPADHVICDDSHTLL